MTTNYQPLRDELERNARGINVTFDGSHSIFDTHIIRDLLADYDDMLAQHNRDVVALRECALVRAERDRLREALRWTAAVLNDAAASAYSLDEDALIKMGDETRTVSQILDAADAALAQEQGESDGATT